MCWWWWCCFAVVVVLVVVVVDEAFVIVVVVFVGPRGRGVGSRWLCQANSRFTLAWYSEACDQELSPRESDHFSSTLRILYLRRLRPPFAHISSIVEGIGPGTKPRFRTRIRFPSCVLARFLGVPRGDRLVGVVRSLTYCAEGGASCLAGHHCVRGL